MFPIAILKSHYKLSNRIKIYILYRIDIPIIKKGKKHEKKIIGDRETPV